MMNMRAILAVLVVASCTTTAPTEEYASADGITLKYSAWDSVPTLTAAARTQAVQHCAKYGKFANYIGGNAVSPLTAEETHQFSCDVEKTDDSRVLAAQSQRPNYVPVPVINSPTQTRCTTIGITTSCSTY
jgi:hypothetical protein